MPSMIKKPAPGLLLSITLHVLVLFALLYHHSQNSFLIPGKMHPVMAELISLPEKPEPKLRKKPSIIKIKKHKVVRTKPHKIQHAHKAQNQEHAGKVSSQLATYLYEKINALKHYPNMAEQLGEQGTTLVAFTLMPSGQIQQLHIVKKSGFADLDTAAMQAVKNAAPFDQKQLNMSAKITVTIPVEFDLQ